MKRDTTKYKYNGEVYGKSRLILAVITDLTSKLSLSIDKLQDMFPKEFNGKFEVVVKLREGKLVGGEYKRYFIDKSEIIILKNGERCVVTNQWGAGNVDNIIHYFKKYLKIKIHKVRAK